MFGCFIKFEIKVIDNSINEIWILERSLEEDARHLPCCVTEKNIKDKMYNAIIQLCNSNKWFWEEPDRYGKHFVMDLCNILWYINGHHGVFSSRSCSIPDIFSSFNGYNKPELSKHRKRSISNMNRDQLLEYATVQPQWNTFKPALLQLIESLSAYASYLSVRSKAMKLCHDSTTPVINFSDASAVRYLQKSPSVSPLLSNIDAALASSKLYQILYVNEFVPKGSRQKYLYIREIERGLSLPCFFFTYTHRYNVENYHFIWRVPDDVSIESCHTQNMH